MDRIAKRKIEAEALRPLIIELERQMPAEDINDLLTKVNVREAFMRGSSLSQSAQGDTISVLLEDVKTWGNGGDMEITLIEQTGTTLHFDVTKCPYQELYKKLGMERYGTALSCCRDEHFAKGLCKKLELKRTKTLMAGDEFCDFRYSLETNNKSE